MLALVEPVNSCYMFIFPKLTNYPGTPSGTYKKLFYRNFPKINVSCPGTPSGTYKYLLCGHFHKIDISYPGTPTDTDTPMDSYYMVISPKLISVA